MASFKALNIESDDEEDIEVDDTKEIQIEEALKLYQAALRFHSEGPASYGQAAEAYRLLFDSDIFKYPESQTELKRIELHGPPVENDNPHLVQQEFVVSSGENAPSTLPQIIHLSYKNHAEFLLESLQYRLRQSAADVAVNTKDITKAASAALDCFVEAIDKDDTDLDLWRRTAAVGDLLGSHRIARFCLEAVLDGDDQGLDSVLALPGISESLAGQQLRELVAKLQDELSLLQSPLSTMRRRQLSKMLKQKLATYTSVRTYQRDHQPPARSKEPPLRSVLRAPKSWQDMGDMLLQQLLGEEPGAGLGRPGLGVSFSADSADSPTDAQAMDVDQPAPRHAHPCPPGMSSLVDDQFPGMAVGQPTAPAPAPAPSPSESGPADTNTNDATSANLPTRKRSGDAAGFLQDNGAGDSGRSKSKRIRARESLVDQSLVEEDAVLDTAEAENALADLDYADNQMFETLDDLLDRFHLDRFDVSPNVRRDLRQDPSTEDVEADGIQLASLDLFQFLNRYSNEQARVLLLANTDLDSTSDTKVQPSGRFSAAPAAQSRASARPDLEPRAGLDQAVKLYSQAWLHISSALYLWVSLLGSPAASTLFFKSSLQPATSSYMGHTWPQSLKTVVVRAIVALDAFNYEQKAGAMETLEQELLDGPTEASHTSDPIFEEIQTLFELHLDVYSLIKEPNSGADKDTVVTQGQRTDRWANLARDAMNYRSSLLERPILQDNLNLRYLWAATHHISVSSHVSQDHVIACWSELRSIFHAVGEPVIELPNNAAIPQMSVEAIDRELSRLTTQDFFTKVFDPELEDLTVVIESLEPLLETLHHQVVNDGDDDAVESLKSDSDDGAENRAVTPSELLNFLKNSNVALQVSLWQRLREAYEGIDYQPMVVCCYFRIVELLLADLKSDSYMEKPMAERQTTLLKYMRVMNDLISKISQATSSHADALECMDMDRLRSAVGCLGDLLKMLHASTLFQDDIQVGVRQTPAGNNGLPLPSFAAVSDVLLETQLHSWTLLYKLFKECLAQNVGKVDNPDQLLFEYLRAVHQALGVRSLCGKSNRVFLRLAKLEVLRFRNGSEEPNDDFDLEFAQILYDLFGLKCFINPSYALREHNCTHDTSVDKTSAMQAVDLLLNLASRIKTTELPKHSLKDTIEKVHGLIVRKKPSEAVLRNRDVYRAFLKSHINPVDLYRCLQGEGQLTLAPVPPEQAILASKGWYFLMGQIALNKFRAQKRIGPAATEDVDIAVAFFMQDLEFSMDSWETWFRLAQAYDSKIEESVSWSAEKLNSSMPELVQQQRAAIHCYSMATSLAMRSAEPGPETRAKLGELYADFAMRMYSSSREPFGMRAFSIDDVEKFLSRETILKGSPFRALTPFNAWKFARELFRRAIKVNPHKWKLHFYLGKCLWKMYCNAPASADQPSIDAIINEFCESINLLPRKKDSKREPTLEPHYKLVSIVHKMVTRRFIDASEGCDILVATHYAAKVDPVYNLESWEPYILKVLKNLRTADKVHWHHRMIYRTAKIVYHDGSEKAYCLAARQEFMQQMFTKTMLMNVWKPENERPGRHFVYTARYADMFIKIIEFLEDRAMLDALARRVRKKPAEFFEHGALWQYLCTAYLKVLRRHGQIPLSQETAIFSGINHEDFLRRKEPLEKWCQDPANADHPTLEAMQEVIELKKINGGLMKAASIDDLIGDAYAYLYDTIGRKLWTAQEAQEEEKKEQEAAKAAEQAALPVPVVQERNPMMNLSHLMNLDGAAETPTPKPPVVPVIKSTETAVPPTEAAPAQSRRKIGVGRREVRLCAEACVSKSAPTTILTAEPVRRPLPEVAVVIETRRPALKVERTDDGSSVAEGESDSELSDVDEDLVNEGQPAGIMVTPKGTFEAPRVSGAEEDDLVSEVEDDEGGDDEEVEADGDADDEGEADVEEDVAMGEDEDEDDVEEGDEQAMLET